MGRRRRPTDDEPVNRDASTPWRCRSEEHTSELQSRLHLVCRLLLEKKKEKMRQMLPHPQTAGQYFTHHQIQEKTRKATAEVALVHQQTKPKRSDTSHIPATAQHRPH